MYSLGVANRSVWVFPTEERFVFRNDRSSGTLGITSVSGVDAEDPGVVLVTGTEAAEDRLTTKMMKNDSFSNVCRVLKIQFILVIGKAKGTKAGHSLFNLTHTWATANWHMELTVVTE